MKKVFYVFLGIFCISIFSSWAIFTYMEENDDKTEIAVPKSSVERATSNIGSSSDYTSIQNIESNNDYTNTFTNAYGTATTICVHSGCTNYIASSGDTNCCVTHSNKCLNCRKYIDEDAMYCMSCLSESVKPSEKSVKSSEKSGGCEYKKSNGEICGAKVGSHAPFCDKHFQELDDVYNSLLGN